MLNVYQYLKLIVKIMSLSRMLNALISLDSVGMIRRISFLFTRGGRRFLSDFSEFKNNAASNDPNFLVKDFMPCLKDYSSESAHLPQHYFYQNFYFANRVFENNPVKHVDIGSRVDGFVAHVASF